MESVILGVDFGGTKVEIALVNLQGKWLVRKKEVIFKKDGFSILKSTLKFSKKILSLHKYRLKAIAISTIGVLKNGKLKLVPTIKNWGQINLQKSFQDSFPDVKVFIKNDVKSAAYGELISGSLKNTHNGLYLNLGTGIAVGLTLGSKVITGFHGAAGEVGYFLNQKDSNIYFQNNHAPFEEYAGGKGIAKHASRLINREISAQDFWQKRFSDQSLIKYRQNLLRILGFQLSNMCIFWDPEIVSLGGGMVKSLDKFKEYLKNYLKKTVPFPPLVKMASYSNSKNASLNGIILYALCKLSSYIA